MKLFYFGFLPTLAALVFPMSLEAQTNCPQFSGSTMQYGGGPVASWRTDYPSRISGVETPWLDHDFEVAPADYMNAVLSQITGGFSISQERLIGSGQEDWWISPWMDYGSSGREPRMGLTKERGPDSGDLSPTSANTYQVWAVGFYNETGATVFGEIFEDLCNPFLPTAVQFPRNTVSMKFLFTDADPAEVSYLEGAPEFEAMIDPTPRNGIPEDRVPTVVRLLQLDIAVKDRRASDTGWVFGTFAWVGPPAGDGLFDNLVPVSLQWGNDPGVYDTTITESWVNPALDGVMFGWPERPALGFNGRANGPADNIRSSCLSCHAAARAPRSSLGILGSQFNMQTDFTDPEKIRKHVDTWFQNQGSKAAFQPQEPIVSTLDYSLQLDAAVFRMCRACRVGDLGGTTPQICRQTGFYNRAVCATSERAAEFSGTLSTEGKATQKALRLMPPPRQ